MRGPSHTGSGLASGAQGGQAEHPSRTKTKAEVIEENLNLLGVLPDGEVARLLHVSARTIIKHRMQRGIPAFAGNRTPPRPRNGLRSHVQQLHDLVGVVPDRVIAEMLNLTDATVRNYRIRHQIPAAGHKTEEEVRAVLRRAAVGAEGAAPSAAGARDAWQIAFADGRSCVFLAADVDAALEEARAFVGGLTTVQAITRVGVLLPGAAV